MSSQKSRSGPSRQSFDSSELLPGRLLAFAARPRLRVLVVWWARDRFPPADDGSFYHVVAQRIAHGQGYTWLCQTVR